MSITKVTRKRKDGNRTTYFRAEVYFNGCRVAEQRFDTKGAAIVWHDEMKSKWKANDSNTIIAANLDLKFSDVFARYKTERLPKLRKTSQQSMASRFDHFESSPLMGIRIADFRATTIDSWLEWLKSNPTAKNLNRDSFKSELKYLAVILNWYRNYYDERFIVPIVKRHHENCYFKDVPQRRPDYYIRPDEAIKWLTHLRDRQANPVFFKLASFMLSTGVRLGEACGLMWDCVDVPRGEIRITRTVAWDHSTKEPYLVEKAKNTESIRLLPLPQALIKLLSEMRAKTNLDLPVFHRPDGRFLSDNSIRKVFNRAFKACGLPWTATHICRHTHATISLIANDGNLSVVQSILGHTDQRITQGYAKVISMPKRDAMNRTAKAFDLPTTEV